MDEEEITTAVEGNDPKKALISLIHAKEGPGTAEPGLSAGGGAEPGQVSAALKGMSVRSLRQVGSQAVRCCL